MANDQELWIDGRVHWVDRTVAGHVKFLSDLNSQFASRIAVYDGVIVALAKLPVPDGGRWTAWAKITLLNLLDSAPECRAAIVRVYGLTEIEIDGWRRSYIDGGAEALSPNYRRQS